jgi:transcriptional regulator with XRE-family HTH domain
LAGFSPMPVAPASTFDRHRAYARPDTTMTRVNARRLHLNITQEDLAQRAGVGIRTVNRLMRGATGDLQSYRAIAGVLDADMGDLWPEHFSAPTRQTKGSRNGSNGNGNGNGQRKGATARRRRPRNH